jgi:hypothetical protein
LVMFTLYCDDSGTHAKSDIAVAACYISTAEQWGHFQRNWEEANIRERFGVFHMADFVSKQGQFSAPEWDEQEKRDRTIRALINLIKTRALIGFSGAVVKSAFDEVIVDSKLREKYGDNHYAFVVRLCTVLVDRWRQKHKYEAPVQYVFDRQSKGKGEINALFGKLLLGEKDAMRRYGVYKDCWSFQDKEKVIPLQAADIWAWENFRYMRDCALSTGLKKTPRRSYLALRESPTEVRYHVRQSLEELVRRVEDSIA